MAGACLSMPRRALVVELISPSRRHLIPTLSYQTLPLPLLRIKLRRRSGYGYSGAFVCVCVSGSCRGRAWGRGNHGRGAALYCTPQEPNVRDEEKQEDHCGWLTAQMGASGEDLAILSLHHI